MVFNCALTAARHEYHLLDTRFPRLIDRILDERTVDDGQHFFRNGLCRWQKAGAETRDREYGFSNRFMCHDLYLTRQSALSMRSRRAVGQIPFSALPTWAE